MKTILSLGCLFVILCLVSKDWKTIKRVMAGWGIVEAIDLVYDFPVWLWLQNHFGIVVGSVYASIGAMLLNVIYLAWYQASKKDWLGVDLLEQIKKEGEEWSNKARNYKGSFLLKTILFFLVYVPAKALKLVVWSLNKTTLITFLVFSTCTDSFKTTVFMRHGKLGGKLNWWDMVIFATSTAISCALWSSFNAILGVIAHFVSFYWSLVFG